MKFSLHTAAERFPGRLSPSRHSRQADPLEVNNLATNPRYAKTLVELREKLKAWGRETNDEMPAHRTPDEFNRETGNPLQDAKCRAPVKGK